MKIALVTIYALCTAATLTVLGGCGAASQAYAPSGGIAIAPNGAPASRGGAAMPVRNGEVANRLASY